MEYALRGIKLLGFRVATAAALLGITIITARWLGPEGRGVYALVMLYATLGVTFLGGAGSALAHQISSKGRPPREAVINAVALAFAIGVVAFVATMAVYWILDDPGLWWLPFAGVAQIVLLTTAAMTWGFLGADDHANYNRAIIAPSIFTLLFLVLLLGPGRIQSDAPGSIQLALLAWLLAQVAVLVWLLWLGRKVWLPPAFGAVTPSSVWALAVFGAQTGLADLISFFNYRVDLFLLELFRGTAQVGVYSVAVNCAEALWFISSAVSVVIYARVGMLPRDEAARLTARGMRHSLILIALLGVGMAAVAGVALPLLFGAEYQESVAAFRLLIPGIIVFGLGRIFSTFFTNALGRPRVPLMIAATSLAVSLPLCALLIPPLGMNGAAIATSVSYTVAIVLALFVFAAETGIPIRDVIVPSREDWNDYVMVVRRAVSMARGGAAPSPQDGPGAETWERQTVPRE